MALSNERYAQPEDVENLPFIALLEPLFHTQFRQPFDDLPIRLQRRPLINFISQQDSRRICFSRTEF